MSCLELDLDLWSESLLAPIQQNERYPIGASFDLTERCNLNCVHCYINQPAGSKAVLNRELDTDQVKSILDKIAQAGCLFLVLTGGDPLLRSDFPEIYMHARRLGMLVTLLTNATLITPEIADLLAASKPHVVDISVYGVSQATYEAVTRVPGSFARFLRGIELLHERDIRFSLKSVILTLNKHELAAMRAFAEKYHTMFRYDALIWPRLDGNESPYQFQLSVEEMLELDLEYPMRLQEWKNRSDLFKGQLVRSEYVYSCGAGFRTFNIDSQGRMSMCTMARHPSYDLNQMSFDEAWANLGELRNMKRQLHTKCESCTVGALCAQCPGWSQVVHGDNETPVDFICQLGQLRAKMISSVDITEMMEVGNEQEVL